MSKKPFIGSLILIVIFVACFIFLQASKKTTFSNLVAKNNDSSQQVNTPKVKGSVHDTATIYFRASLGKEDTIPQDWKQYNNENIGLTFQYPNTWKVNQENKATNRKGEVLAFLVSLIDTASNSTFLLEYHVPPYGAELFKFIKQQADSLIKHGNNTKLVQVGGMNAIESTTIMKADIKGNNYDPPLKIVHVDFLDKSKTGSYSLSFQTLLPLSKTEVLKFNQLLLTFKFTN